MTGKAVPLVRWGDAAKLGVSVAFTTRRGGVSRAPYDSLNLGLHVGDQPEHVALNRARAAAAFGVTLEDLVFARQVHGTRAAVVGPPERGRGTRSEEDALPDTDILVTTAPEVVLVIMVADCVPLALVDPQARVLASVHAGWRGTAARAVVAALDAMVGCGARPDRVHAFLGPAVDHRRYQVTDDVAQAVAHATPRAESDPRLVRPDGPGHWLLDLVAANRLQLRAAGVRDDNIGESGLTTADPDLFSDRVRRPCGRIALLARLAP